MCCGVFQDEIELLAPEARHIRVRKMLDIGLHDRPQVMRQTLQQAVDEIDGEDAIEAVVLVYGLCGLGTAGLKAGRHPLVITRAHDCMTLFLGSKERYAEIQAACPDCHYYTPGWNRARRVPGPERLAALRAELSARFDKEEVDYLVETEQALWDKKGHAICLDLGTAGAGEEEAYARRCADALGWSFEHITGDPGLLRDLLWGRWDDRRFQIIPPGSTLKHDATGVEIFKSSRP